MKFTTDKQRLAEYRRLVEECFILLARSEEIAACLPRDDAALDQLLRECQDAACRVAGAERGIGMEEKDIRREKWPLRVKYHIGDQDLENRPAGT